MVGKVDLKVIDQEEMDQAERVGQVHVKRFQAAKVFVDYKTASGSSATSRNQGTVFFPLAEGSIGQPGLDVREQQNLPNAGPLRRILQKKLR